MSAYCDALTKIDSNSFFSNRREYDLTVFLPVLKQNISIRFHIMMEYDRGDSFPFDFEPNGILIVSKCNQIEYYLVQNWKENCNHDEIPLNLKGNKNLYVLWVQCEIKLGMQMGLYLYQKIEPFDLYFELRLFLQAATDIGRNKSPDLVYPLTVVVYKNKWRTNFNSNGSIFCSWSDHLKTLIFRGEEWLQI